MPFISVQVAGSLLQEQKDAITISLGKSISLIPGKSEKQLMVDISDGHSLYFGGKPLSTGAYVDVRTFGDSDFESKKALTESIYEMLHNICGIQKNEIYVTFSAFSEWGTRGSLYKSGGRKMENMEEMDGIMTLMDENGNETEYEFVDSIVFENAEYVVLLPVEDVDCEAVILAVETDGDVENYVAVDDEEILNGVYEIFKERFADQLDFVD